MPCVFYLFSSFQGAFDFTATSEIPDDEELANTYYSQGDEFEDECCSTTSSSESEDDDYDALMEHMNNALELKDTCDSMAVENIGPSLSHFSSTTIRNRKIESLRE